MAIARSGVAGVNVRKAPGEWTVTSNTTPSGYARSTLVV
jgi:hypothetical protein